MNRTPITPNLETIPEVFHPLLKDSAVFDSSCSSTARVYYLDRDGGLFLKTAPKGTLEPEQKMDAYFHSLGFGPEVLSYHSTEADWLLTRRVPGEDCLFPAYLEKPDQLAETMARMLFDLHRRDPSGCPVQDHTRRYLETARNNYAAGCYDLSFYPENPGTQTLEKVWNVVEENARYLKTDTLLHGDFCLPNIMLEDWQPSGFIDVGRGGVGDRHVDLFWGVWTLNFNLKTDKYGSVFLDAYGRNHFEPELLRVIGAFEVFE